MGVLCLHWNSIEIKPRPQHSEPLKNMSVVMLHFLLHICVYRMTWSINSLNTKLKHPCADIEIEEHHKLHWSPSVSVSPMWPNIMNINNCNTWQLLATCYGNRVWWLFPHWHLIKKFVIWFTVEIICTCLEIPSTYQGIGLERDL